MVELPEREDAAADRRFLPRKRDRLRRDHHRRFLLLRRHFARFRQSARRAILGRIPSGSAGRPAALHGLRAGTLGASGREADHEVPAMVRPFPPVRLRARAHVGPFQSRVGGHGSAQPEDAAHGLRATVRKLHELPLDRLGGGSQSPRRLVRSHRMHPAELRRSGLAEHAGRRRRADAVQPGRRREGTPRARAAEARLAEAGGSERESSHASFARDRVLQARQQHQRRQHVVDGLSRHAGVADCAGGAVSRRGQGGHPGRAGLRRPAADVEDEAASLARRDAGAHAGVAA